MEKSKTHVFRLSAENVALVWYLIDEVHQDFCDNPGILHVDPVTEENFHRAFCEEVSRRYGLREHGVAVGDVVTIHGYDSEHDGDFARVTAVEEDGSVRVAGGVVDALSSGAGKGEALDVAIFDVVLRPGQYRFNALLSFRFREMKRRKASKEADVQGEPDLF